MEAKQTLTAFLGLYDTVNGDGYLGAILVSDQLGVPQEFRCTHPVKPTAIQKPLYGDALKPYIGIVLCGVPLIKAVQSKPELVVVNAEFMLGVRSECNCPVILVRRAGEAIDIDQTGEPKTKVRERLDSPTGRFQPLIISPHQDYPTDKDQAREVLSNLFDGLDLLEPFDRMAKALEVLAKQDTRFQ